MKKGQIVEGIVERYTFPNKGYVNVEDRWICIKGALLGQKVRFSIKRLKHGAGEGRLLEVLEKSSLEDVEPSCPHFGACGGCAYQTMSYENQLRLNVESVDNSLVQMGDNSADEDNEMDVPQFFGEDIADNLGKEHPQRAYIWEGIKGSPVTTAYRNKMEYSFGDEYKDGPLSLGMHRKGGFHDIVTVDQCVIVDDDYNAIIRAVRDFYEEKQVPFYKKMQHVGMLRHLVVRQAACSKDILVNLVTTTRDDLREDVVAKKDLTREIRETIAQDDPNTDNVLSDGSDEVNVDMTGVQDVNDELQKELSDKLYLPELQERLLSLDLYGRIVGILHTWNDSLSDAVVPQRVITLYGKDYLYEEILGLRFKISPFSFFQTNTRSAEVLYETARSYVMSMGICDIREKDELKSNDSYNIQNDSNEDSVSDADDTMAKGEALALNSFKDKVIFDLYSGTGTIAQMLAPVAKKVVGIEIVEEAVEAAKENAALNGLTNCEFIAGDVLKVLDTVEDKPDIIVLDPPRDGCNPKALEKIIAYGVPEMVYISCKPTSLARDLVTLQARGYRVVKACAVDQFPGTLHVESIVLLSKVIC